MKSRPQSPYRIAAMVVLLTCSLLWMASTDGVAAPKEIRIGASIPLTGLGATAGTYGKWGYSTPINDINKAGGIYLSTYGKKLPVRLILYDDQVDPAKTAANIERLILRDDVHALLGSAGPEAVVAAGTVAEREGVPMITAQSPIRSFLRGRDQWRYVWDVFFDEQDMARQQFLTMNMVTSNRKIALFTEHAPDGITLGNLWNTYAPEFGYEVVYHATFPVRTSEFGDLIRRAQERQAEIVISVAWLNETIALWRQMRTLGYKPKAVFLEKGAEPVEWWRVNGQAAHGTCMVGYWHPALGYPGAQELRQRFEQDTGLPYSQIVATTYAVSQILLDAIERAGNLDPGAINAAIAKTDRMFAVGHVRFQQGKDGNVSVLPTFMLQWQDGETRIVYPPQLANATFIYPLP